VRRCSLALPFLASQPLLMSSAVARLLWFCAGAVVTRSTACLIATETAPCHARSVLLVQTAGLRQVRAVLASRVTRALEAPVSLCMRRTLVGTVASVKD
jgi:hypothetical protein